MASLSGKPPLAGNCPDLSYIGVMHPWEAYVIILQVAIGSFVGFLAALAVWNWSQRRKQAKLVRRGMELLHPDLNKYNR
jgi:hypothetical protein